MNVENDGGEQNGVKRQLPLLNGDNRAFWTGGERGELLIMHCLECDRYIHPPRPRCGKCGAGNVAPKAVSGHGAVKAFTINVQQWVPNLEVPYVVAAIELVEQERLYVFANVIGCEPAEVRSGMTVAVEFERFEDVWLPLFRPVEAAA
jgi:uncharacterized OB-fold protein